jgi:adenylate cyclase
VTGTELKQRLAAILAADVAGYSRLMAADERATVAALDAARAVFRAQIESNQGRVIDMAGDSVLAVFETATGAVSAALSVQRELDTSSIAVPEDRRMRFRIGLHMGDVMEKGDGTIYGDGVNIAARLEGLAEPGGITVSESIRTAVKGKVSAGFEDQGEQMVKNIPDPVRAYRVRAESAVAMQTVSTAAAKLSIGAGVIDLSLPDRPSIAVLPFANMSGEAEQEYFTDGVTEDIITELSRFRSLFVIARNTTFTYKGKPVDIQQVGKELGVRYVLEGSIRKSGNRVRVTGQLIDALTGTHIWAERYDRVLEDIFAVQEELTQNIVSAIAPHIVEAEAEKARRRRPENLSAYEIAVCADAHARQSIVNRDPALGDQAIREAKKALAIDPESLLSLDVLAKVILRGVIFRTADDLDAAWREGLAYAEKAIELDRSDSRGYSNKAMAFVFSLDGGWIEDALTAARRAHQLNPNDVRAIHGLGYTEMAAGNPARGREILLQALRVSPRDPLQFVIYHNLAQSYFLEKDYAKALEYGLLGASEAPDYPMLPLQNAAIYVGLNQIQKAKAAFETARRLAPAFVQYRSSGMLYFRNPEHRQRFVTFSRIAAGLDDPSAADAFR